MKLLGWFGLILALSAGMTGEGTVGLVLALVKFAVGFGCVLVAFIRYDGSKYYLNFRKKNEIKDKVVETYTYLGKLWTKHKYKKLGYVLIEEWEVS